MRKLNPFSVPIDLVGQTINTVRGENFDTLQGNVAPSIEAYYGFIFGKDLETGRKLSDKERLGSQILQAAPLGELVHPRESKTFGEGTRMEALIGFYLVAHW